LEKIKKPFIWILIISSIYGYSHPHGVFVLADPLSVYRYRGVLNDLKREMPQEYELVKNHIDTITIDYIMMGNHAGTAREGKYDKKQVPGYAHSVIVHEACHVTTI
jgi:hypothetical protein